ncbi:MAG: aldo/keto reductase [Phycisphaeraceae bacterium]|nr:aldo/keto reductase [Phycisphaeraceae bacterium]
MTFGREWGFGADVDESRRIIDTYLDRGGNFLDTANIYTHGHSEKIIGDHIGRHPSRRARLVLATKFMGNMYPDDPNGGGGGRKAIVRACEQSLRRLQTDYIDLYWMHFWDRHTPIEETMRALDDLVRAGKVLHLGFSDTPAWKCAQAQTEAVFRSWTPLIALQIEYSLIERTVEGDLIPMALELGLGVTPWSPLKGGILTGKYTRGTAPPQGDRRYAEDSKHLNERTFTIVEALRKVSSELGVSPAQVALAWVQQRPGVTSTIIGARTVPQLIENLAALDCTLPAELSALLDEASTPVLPFPHAFLQNLTNCIQNGTCINGVPSARWPLSPADDQERF